jgi:hypothetical protein
LALADCLSTLADVVHSYEPAKSVYRTPYVVPGWKWHGRPGYENPPEMVVTCSDTDDYPLFVAFWSDRGSTEIGLFPLGTSDERLTTMPIVGYWKQRDSSLTSIGLFPGSLIELGSPRLPEQFDEEILRTAGYPLSPRNIAIIGTAIGDMFLGRAYQLIASKDIQGARAFVQRHPYTNGPIEQYCQKILEDLATGYRHLVPYIQDIPMRARAVALEVRDDPDTVWRKLER